MSARSMAQAVPAIRGRLRSGVVLAPLAWMRVGGPAEWLAQPADVEDLAQLLRARPAGLPLTVIGAASNLLIRDGGIPGLTLRLGGAFAGITVEPDGIVAGAAALDAVIAEHAAQAGLAGLEFLCGIPGSLGGAVAMNAGAYGGDIAAVLDWAELATADGVLRLAAAELGFAYREALLPPGAVVIRARLRATPGDPTAIGLRMGAIRAARAASQPVRARTGGSTFRNPPNARAWELIDAAGCRGLRLGAAEMSPLHCNFLVNTGGATAAELEALGEAVRTRVLLHSGIDLRWEIRRLGTQGESAA